MMDAICNPARGNRRLKTRMLMLAALAAAGFGGAAAAQSLQPETIAAIPADRLCTAGFNPDYGWFDVDSIGFGVLEFPGALNASCTKATTAGLAVQLGGLTLPLMGQAVYGLATVPPTLSLPLLEPVLCEDYYNGAAGSGSWKLSVKDANNETMHFNVGLGSETMAGVSTLSYQLASGTLVPQRVDTTVQWLRCHAGLAPNAVPPTTGPGTADHLFADSLEPAMADLRVELIDLQTGNPIVGDVLQQSTTGNVQFKVRVSNRGTADAQNVRIREFVPTAAALMGPTVSRVSCFDHGAASNCNSGSGTSKLVENIGSLVKGTQREYTLTRKSSSTDTSAGQSMALVQVAAFSDPNASPDSNYADNSRSLRIQVVNQVQVARAVSTNGIAGDASGGTITRVSAPAGCSAEAGGVTTCPPGTSGLVYSAAANPAGGYTFTGFTGCTGTQSSTVSGGTFTTTSSASCTLTANFRSMPTVTASVTGSNGTISPSSQTIHYNQQASLTVTPSTGYTVDTISGCGGVTHVGGTNWQTAPVTGNCAVAVTFKAITSTVTVNAGPHGVITSTNPFTITYPTQQAVFTALPDASYQAVIAASSTCQTSGPVPNPFGAGVMFAAENVLGNCTIDLEFNLILHPVTVASGILHGSVTVANGGQVPHGQSASFTLAPDVGYHVAGVTGTPACGTISVSGNTGSAGPITSAGCELTASFAINEYTVTVSLADPSGTHGTIGPQGAANGDVIPVVVAPVQHGSSAEVWTFPETGYHADFPVNPSCQLAFAGFASGGIIKYKATSVTADCNLSVQFLPD